MQIFKLNFFINILLMAVLVTLFFKSSALQALEKFSVAGWSKPISEITNLLAEPDKGFFRAEGINLIYVSGNGGGSAITNMLSGAADIAFTDPASFYQALDRKEKLIAIYNIYPQNVFNVVSPKSRNITKPADLKGKKIGVYSLSSGTRQNLQVLLHQVGLSERDVTIQVTGLLNFAPVIQGQVDATAATDTGLFVGKFRGLRDVNVIEVKNYLNIPSDMFVVTETTYNKRKNILRRFLSAYKKSSQWMIDQPREAARIAKKRSINGRDEDINFEIIKLRNASSVSKTTRMLGLGHFDLDLLQKGVKTFKELGLITGSINIEKVVKSDLIPD